MITRRRDDARGRGTWQGMNWIRQDKRLAIYLRDGLACAWCGSSIEVAARLTLDHVLPHSKGGTNEETNLVTACERCNSSRADRSASKFAKAVAIYLDRGTVAREILSHVNRTRRRSIKGFRVQARELIVSRGSAAKVLGGVA